MNQATFVALDYASNWRATCPSCDAYVSPADVPCPNCKKGRLRYFRESHASDERRWNECGLVCRSCGVKFKSILCPTECGSVIMLSSIDCYISIRRFDAEDAASTMGCLLAVVFVAASYWIMAKLRQILGVRISGFLPFLIYVLAFCGGYGVVIRTVSGKAREAWYSYDR